MNERYRMWQLMARYRLGRTTLPWEYGLLPRLVER